MTSQRSTSIASPRRKPASTSTSITTTTTTNANANANSNTSDNEANSRGLRTSLDQGMAAVRRWIVTKSGSAAEQENLSPSLHNHIHNDNMDNSEDECLIDFSPPYEDFASPTNSSMSVDGDRLSSTAQQQQHHQQHLGIQSQRSPHHPPIQEESSTTSSYHRQRSLSEPDAVRIRDFLFQQAVSAPQRRRNRRRRHPTGDRRSTTGASMELSSTATSTSPGNNFLYSAPPRSTPRLTTQRSNGPTERTGGESSVGVQEDTSNPRSSGNDSGQEGDSSSDRVARERWALINRRFQVVINVVALIFSLLLFAILICWVGLTCAYIASLEKTCDVPLKTYYWLVTLQLILDVFRTDIMRLFFRWDANSNQRIPCRVITYNFAYLTYALLVLRLGVNSILMKSQTTCRLTAPELFQASSAFVYLSSAAWSTILFGYLVPFCFVAIILTWNGYTPSSDSQSQNRFTVFPTAMSAPPGCVDRLRVVTLNEFPAQYPAECCICMEHFTPNELIVATECNHVFHKQCCASWLRQARTCPVCRMDIPNALEQAQGQGRRIQQPRRVRIQEASRTHLHHEVATLLQIVRSRDLRLRNRRREALASSSGRGDDARSQGTSGPRTNLSSNLEEGRAR
jgi:hypothetical protein